VAALGAVAAVAVTAVERANNFRNDA